MRIHHESIQSNDKYTRIIELFREEVDRLNFPKVDPSDDRFYEGLEDIVREKFGEETVKKILRPHGRVNFPQPPDQYWATYYDKNIRNYVKWQICTNSEDSENYF